MNPASREDRDNGSLVNVRLRSAEAEGLDLPPVARRVSKRILENVSKSAWQPVGQSIPDHADQRDTA